MSLHKPDGALNVHFDFIGNAIHHEALKSFTALTLKATETLPDPSHVTSSQVIAG